MFKVIILDFYDLPFNDVLKPGLIFLVFEERDFA
jgi:hypothetical protein